MACMLSRYVALASAGRAGEGSRKVLPVPQGLVWPYRCTFLCIFVTGLTHNSVYLLAQAPENCGPECVVVPVFTIGVLLALVLLQIDLLAFRRKHGSGVN